MKLLHLTGEPTGGRIGGKHPLGTSPATAPQGTEEQPGTGGRGVPLAGRQDEAGT